MSCNCISAFEKDIVERQPYKELKIIEAKFDLALIFENSGKIQNRPVLEVELTVEGRKKPLRKSVIYSFCPFCGNEYDSLTPKEKEVIS